MSFVATCRLYLVIGRGEHKQRILGGHYHPLADIQVQVHKNISKHETFLCSNLALPTRKSFVLAELTSWRETHQITPFKGLLHLHILGGKKKKSIMRSTCVS